MNVRRIGSALRICAAAALVFSAFSGSAAQPTSTGSAVPEQTVDRSAVVKEILDAWSTYEIPVDSENNTPWGPFDFRAALKSATPEQLLDARKAKTFEDVVSALPRATGGGIVTRRLALGQPIPLVIGSDSNDLVFTPVTPCRIMDTRFQTVPARIGPDAGVQRTVVGSNYSAQGGVASSCGIPSTGPAGIAINVATTNQSGTGSLRIIPTGAGNPPTAIMNYSPIQNISNAAVVAAAPGAGNNIFIYSASAAVDVIIDIMGYFTSPAATPVDNTIVNTATAVLSGVTFDVFSPACPAGYRLVSGGMNSTAYQGIANFTSSRPAQGASNGIVTGTNTGDRWLCQGFTASATTINCSAICARIPGN